MSFKIPIALEVSINYVEGKAVAAISGARVMTEELDKTKVAAAETTRELGSQSYAIRRLALDLRMTTIGLVILKREFGGINPIIDVTISGLSMLSATTSVLVGGFSMLTNATKYIRMIGGDAASTWGSLSNILGMVPFQIGAIVAIGAVMGTIIATSVYEAASGIGALRKEIEGLQQDLIGLQSTMRDVSVQQADLNVEQARYRFIIESLKEQIKLTGDPTGQLAVQLKAAEEASAGLNVESARLTYRQAAEQAAIAHTTDAIKDREEAIEKANRAAREALFGMPQEQVAPMGEEGLQIWRPYYMPPEQQLGGEARRAGLVEIGAGEVISQREQFATALMGGGTGPISIAVNFPNAQITNPAEMVSAMRRGGNLAAQEVRLELMRKRSRTR